jgi:hypothetical protein
MIPREQIQPFRFSCSTHRQEAVPSEELDPPFPGMDRDVNVKAIRDCGGADEERPRAHVIPNRSEDRIQAIFPDVFENLERADHIEDGSEIDRLLEVEAAVMAGRL